jgi:hypothetical protein
LIDPFALSPKDINSLFKTAAELERKARLDQPVIGSGNSLVDDDNPNFEPIPEPRPSFIHFSILDVLFLFDIKTPH